MKHAIAIALVLAACGSKKPPADDPSPSGKAGAAYTGAKPQYSTIDPAAAPPNWQPAGGTVASPSPAPPPTPTASPTPTPTPTTTKAGAGSGAGSGSGAPALKPPPPPPPPPGPPPMPGMPTTTHPTPNPPKIAANSCTARARECSVTLTVPPPQATPAAPGTKGAIDGQLETTDHIPSCPVDLVGDGGRRITSATTHDGHYKVEIAGGHYNVSFERCLGCDPGLIPIDLADGANLSVSLSCVVRR